MDSAAIVLLLLASAVTLVCGEYCSNINGLTGKQCHGNEFCCNEGFGCCTSTGIGVWGVIAILFAVILGLSILCSCCKVCLRRTETQQGPQQRTQHRLPPNSMVAVITPAYQQTYQQGTAPVWQYGQPPPPYTVHNLYPATPYPLGSPSAETQRQEVRPQRS